MSIQKETMNEVTQILQKMVAHLLVTKPIEPVAHMIQFLQDLEGKGAAPLSKEERIQLDALKDEYAKLKEKKASIKQKKIEGK